MTVKLLTEHNLKSLGLKGGCRGSSESTHVKIPHCWKSHALAHFSVEINNKPYLVCVKLLAKFEQVICSKLLEAL